MSLRLILAASAAVAFAAPAFAQDAPASPPAAEQQASAEEAALEAAGQTLDGHIQAMSAELGAAVQAANGDRARASADMDAIVARYQPEIDAFADALDAYLAAQMESTTDPAARQELSQGRTIGVPQLRGLAGMIKAGILAQMAAAPAPVQPPAQ